MKKIEEESTNKHIKVLMYHRVLRNKPKGDTAWHYVTEEMFEKQMNWLDKLGYTGITFTDYKLYLEGKLTLPKKSIIVTFDDGYLDIYENALPIMQKYNIRAVLFVMGNRKVNKAEWDEVEGEEPCYLMSDNHIRTADSLGFEIGAHSMDHLDLVNLSFSDLNYEIMRSKRQIEGILEKPVCTFSYPYGRVDERVQQVAVNSGYDFACGVYTGPPSFGKNNYDIRRIAINNNVGTLGFLFRILTPFQYLHWAYSILKGISQKLSEVLSPRKVEKVTVRQSAN